jgi:hypothetical protein
MRSESVARSVLAAVLLIPVREEFPFELYQLVLSVKIVILTPLSLAAIILAPNPVTPHFKYRVQVVRDLKIFESPACHVYATGYLGCTSDSRFHELSGARCCQYSYYCDIAFSHKAIELFHRFDKFRVRFDSLARLHYLDGLRYPFL